MPVFHEGEHFFTVAVKAHQADVGNSLPTTYMAQAADVYQEGALIFPCVQVQRDFKDIDDIIRMCERRIRVPEQWYGDYLAAVGAARIGERSLKAFIAKYGAHTVRHFTEEWFDYSERRCIEAIRTLPKGKLKGSQAHDPVEPWVPDGIPINVTIDIDPDAAKVTVDLRDNIDCIDAGLNLTETTSTMAAVQGVLTCLGEDLPPNSGTMRRIEVLLRENCAVGIPRFPHSCSVATTNLTDVIVNVTQSAFAELGEGQGFAHGNYCNSAAAGVASGTDWRRNGEPYINQMFMMGGGGGASAENDGMHYLFVPVAAGLLYRDSIEINEQRFPVLIEKMHVMTDSMGHGRRRGGPATEVVMGPRNDPMRILHVCNGLESAPKGVRGGTGSRLGGNAKIAQDGSEHPYPAVMVCDLEGGERLRARDQGGGGYGTPAERETHRVLNDVAERYISAETARAVYGVAITGSIEDDSSRRGRGRDQGASGRDERGRRSDLKAAPARPPGPRRAGSERGESVGLRRVDGDQLFHAAELDHLGDRFRRRAHGDPGIALVEIGRRHEDGAKPRAAEELERLEIHDHGPVAGIDLSPDRPVEVRGIGGFQPPACRNDQHSVAAFELHVQGTRLPLSCRRNAILVHIGTEPLYIQFLGVGPAAAAMIARTPLGRAVGVTGRGRRTGARSGSRRRCRSRGRPRTPARARSTTRPPWPGCSSPSPPP